jgi:hypothetical protein
MMLQSGESNSFVISVTVSDIIKAQTINSRNSNQLRTVAERKDAMQQQKRILSIEVKHIPDTNPDTSYLGEYSNTSAGEFSITRSIPGQYHYFNPGSVEPFNSAASWIPADRAPADKESFWRETMRENARRDYERMEAYNRDEWGFIGIRAEATVIIGEVCRIRNEKGEEIVTGRIHQFLTSGGLWGIESDSDQSYFREVEQEELNQLRRILHEWGFSFRAIAAAVKESK